uniref:TolC family protein n=1 Tax=Chryseobacterium endophyticum TaxID=1854762 RepID=A0AAU6WUG7_9FLAO
MKRLTRYSLITITFCGVLQSCKVTRDYQRPELNLPAKFRDAPDNMKTSEIPAYRDFFKDRELLTLLDQVMAKNPDLLIASEEILASEAQLKSVKLNYLPDISLQVNTGLQRLSKNSMQASFGGGVTFQEYNFAPVVSWDVDFWGKLKKQREESLANYLSRAENRRALRVQLVAQTAQAYYNLLSLDQQLSITQQVEKICRKPLPYCKPNIR